MFLNIEQLQDVYPAIFSEAKAERTSDKYTHIPTFKIVQGLAAEGFLPVDVKQSRSLSPERKAYTKHAIRFRRHDAKPDNKGLFPELVLTNSHDGLSSYRLMAGIYRQVCSNGLIVGDDFKEIRVRHQGDIIGNVIEGTYEVIKHAGEALERANHMAAIELTGDEQLLLARAAHALRFKDQDDEAVKLPEPESMLRPRRYGDSEPDLWTTFNVIQENVIKGGLRGYKRQDSGRWRRTTTKEVRSIDTDTALNRALWMLAEGMAKLKAA